MSTKFPGYRFLMIGEVVEPGDLFVGSDGKTFESEMIGWAVADPYGGKYIRREPATPAPESPAPALLELADKALALVERCTLYGPSDAAREAIRKYQAHRKDSGSDIGTGSEGYNG